MSSVSSISRSVSELQQAAVLLSASQIIQASLCYCWWSINQLLFHSSGGLCLNTHLLHVHLTWWFFQWMAELQLRFYIHLQKNTLLELSARHKTSTTSSEALSCFSCPSTSYPYSFFNPSVFILRSSPGSCLLLSSARFHLSCLRRQLHTLHASPDKLKHFTLKTRRNLLRGSCHFCFSQ